MAYITASTSCTMDSLDDPCCRCGSDHDDRGIWRSLPLSEVNIYVCVNCYVWMMGSLLGTARTGLKWSSRKVLVPNAR